LSTTIDITTVTNAIAALTITGVLIKDVDEVAASIGLGFGILTPRPDDFITGVSITPAELSKQNLDVRYTLHYHYFHCAIGQDLFADFAPLVTKIGAIIKAFCNDAKLTGSIDGGMPTIGRVGPIMDAAGNKYHGCEFSMPILQFLEV
jgi:hypothetical protein